LPTSARVLFYELVQRGQLSKTNDGARRPDQNLHDALMDLRESERVPWNWIVEETRSLADYTGYQTIKQGVVGILPGIELDPWKGQPPMILTARWLACCARSCAAMPAALPPPTDSAAAFCAPTSRRSCKPATA
jgi:hypothetical protein